MLIVYVVVGNPIDNWSYLTLLLDSMSTHIEVTHRAEYYLSQFPQYQEYVDILKDHPRALQAGAFFPDWGFNCGDAHEAAEQGLLSDCDGFSSKE